MDEDCEQEMIMFRVMFSTAFIDSKILLLNNEEIDVAWNAKDQFPRDFKAEVRSYFLLLELHLPTMLKFIRIFIPITGTIFRL